MLKKVVISLLILSAISTEGIINIPLEVYKIYLSYGSLLDIDENKDTSLDVFSEEDVDFVALLEAALNEKLISSGEIENYLKSDSSKAKVYCTAPLNAGFDPLLSATGAFPSSGHVSRVVLETVFLMSDSSPPQFLL